MSKKTNKNIKESKCESSTKDKEDDSMAVMTPIVPILKGNAAKDFIKDISSAHINTYSDNEKIETLKKLSTILSGKKNNGIK